MTSLIGSSPSTGCVTHGARRLRYSTCSSVLETPTGQRRSWRGWAISAYLRRTSSARSQHRHISAYLGSSPSLPGVMPMHVYRSRCMFADPRRSKRSYPRLPRATEARVEQAARLVHSVGAPRHHLGDFPPRSRRLFAMISAIIHYDLGDYPP